MARNVSRLSISLRVALLLIVVFGLWLGWRVNKARDQRIAVATVNKYNGHVEYDFEYADGKRVSITKRRAPESLRRFFGDEYFQEVTRVIYVDQPISDATLAPLENLTAIEELCYGSRLGHHTLPEVKPPPGLDGLTELGLSQLENLTQLRRIDIETHALSGSMLNHLNRAHLLERIHLFDVGMTDRGMPPLRSMPNLSELYIACNQVTGEHSWNNSVDRQTCRYLRFGKIQFLWLASRLSGH